MTAQCAKSYPKKGNTVSQPIEQGNQQATQWPLWSWHFVAKPRKRQVPHEARKIVHGLPSLGAKRSRNGKQRYILGASSQPGFCLYELDIIGFGRQPVANPIPDPDKPMLATHNQVLGDGN